MQLDPELSPRKGKQLPAAHETVRQATNTSCGPQQLNQDSWRELYEADKDGDCQLHLAIASGFTEVVFALIRMAPHPDFLDIQNNELYAPLHIAVLMNQPNMVRRLIVAGATSDIRDLEGNTPLHLASKRGYLECAEALLRSISTEELKEACVNASSSHLTLHKILDTKNYQGEHSVHLATFGLHYNFIRFLCWSGADMNATEGRSGKTCLHYAVNKRDLNLVGLLASKKTLGGCEVDLNTRDWCGRTPLLCAIINGDTDIASLLNSQPGCESVTYQESDEDFEADDCTILPFTSMSLYEGRSGMSSSVSNSKSSSLSWYVTLSQPGWELSREAMSVSPLMIAQRSGVLPHQSLVLRSTSHPPRVFFEASRPTRFRSLLFTA